VCNAWNHSLGCTCGWGGEGHLGGGGYGGYGWVASSTWGGGTSLDSPNAHCPRCQDPVYFVRPLNGGALWLDEMGPPWPKHPCMDDAAERGRFPEPLDYPRLRVPSTPPAAWPNRYGSLLSTFIEKGRYWALYVGGPELICVTQPPAAYSPAYVRWQDSDRTLGELEYLTLIDSEFTSVRLRVYSSDVFQSWRYRGRRVDDTHWEMLAKWINDLDVIGPDETTAFVASLRDKIEWLLEPGWTRAIADPPMVRSRVERLCQDYPNLDPVTLTAWVFGLLS
jgi:hypothetical protein